MGYARETVKNDLNAAVPKFCLAVEEYRRTADGRVRSSQEFLAHFFPHDDKGATDQVFRHIPNDVRGPILAQWGIRGLKAALRDSDDKVQSVVHDALVAGDVDHAAFEQGLAADVLVRWVPLASWWTFWRAGKLSKKAIGRALETAYELALFDAKWLLDTLESRGGKLRGTDVIAEGLTKADLTEWVKRIHVSGDGSPKGILAAIGWEKVVAQTANEVLVSALDALATKVGLSAASAASASTGASTSTAPGAPAGGGKPTMPPSMPPLPPHARVAASENAPELVVGETALGEGDMSAFTEEALAIVVDEDIASVREDVSSSSTRGSSPGISKASTSSSRAPSPSEEDLALDLRKLVEEDEEPEENTAVFPSEQLSKAAPAAKR